MCRTCGCSDHLDYHLEGHRVHREAAGFHGQPESARLRLLASNDRLAEHNRQHLKGLGIACLNLMSAPGSGKTRLLEQITPDMGSVLVIEGDLSENHDVERLRRVGVPSLQIQTGQACHLDADMIHHVLHHLSEPYPDWLVIENLGNLACPADFDLGEGTRVALVSVTEGDDKPLKYPRMMKNADALIISKIDLMPHVDFSLESCTSHALGVNPKLAVFPLSAASGHGLAPFLSWIGRRSTRAIGAGA